MCIRDREGLAAYVGSDPTFPSIEGMEIALRPYHASFGPLSPTQLLRMTQNNARRRPDGTYGFDYDPHIGDALKTGPLQDVNLWPVYDAVCCPTLVLHGAVSTLLTSEVAEEMTRRGPKASVVDFPGVGHAPALLSQDQIGAVRDFLLS